MRACVMTVTSRTSAVMMLLGVLLFGCGGEDEPADPTDGGMTDMVPDQAAGSMCEEATPDTLDGACSLASRVGGFLVENQNQFTIVTGEIADAVLPQSVRIEKASDGDCRLLERPVLFCDPACGAGQTCDGQQCIPYPSPQDHGTVRIDGLQDCVQMAPTPPGNNYFFNGLGRPGFAPGDAVHLSAPDLSLHGIGVAPLEESDEVWLLRRGQPLEVRWTAGAVAEARVALSVSIDQHGSSPLSLECLVPDTGMTRVPASLIDQLIDGGVSGAPSGLLRRQTADSVTIDAGCVDFIVASTRTRAVRIDGFTFCTDDAACPDGQRCDTAREVCVDP